MEVSIGRLSLEIKKIQEEIVGDIGGKCPLHKACLLAWLIARYNLNTSVEIGIYRGASFLPQLLAHTQFTKGTGYGIDPYLNGEAMQNDLPNSLKEIVEEFIECLDFEKIYYEVLALIDKFEFGLRGKVLRDTSERAISYFTENEIFFDLLHIDGNHDTDHVMLDVDLYLPRVKKTGFIVLDDIRWPSVEPAYRAVASKCTLLFERVEQFSSWAVFYNDTELDEEKKRELKVGIESAYLEFQEFQALQKKHSEHISLLQEELDHSRLCLERAEEELERTKEQLTGTRGQLEYTWGQLEYERRQVIENQNALALARETIGAMEESKFWRLRKRWFDLRQRLGLDHHQDVGIVRAVASKLKGKVTRLTTDPKERFAALADDRIIILDDIFPHLLSAFRIAEYNTYLARYPNAVVYSTGTSFKYLNDTRSFQEVLQDYLEYYPQFKSRVFEFSSDLMPILRGRLVYLIFLNNTFNFIDLIEKSQIPFIFTLYPGGGFIPDDEESDKKLFRVCSSKYFQKVIVTQKYIGDYLINKKMCTPDQVELIYGVVTSIETIIPDQLDKKYYKLNKETFDICFVAHKYMIRGLNKGYDVFIEVAKILYNLHGSNIVFHVVGNFDEKDIEVSELKDNIKFYGTRTTDWFPQFYANMDIIMSPNIPLHYIMPEVKKSFIDGFPTGCCVEAGFCGTVVFCTDTVNQNIAFKNGEDIVIIPRDIEAICTLVSRYYHNPQALYELSRIGQHSFRKIFKLENQMEPRLRLISEALTKT
jgi:predicted O-methyltransferase YrrM